MSEIEKIPVGTRVKWTEEGLKIFPEYAGKVYTIHKVEEVYYEGNRQVIVDEGLTPEDRYICGYIYSSNDYKWWWTDHSAIEIVD